MNHDLTAEEEDLLKRYLAFYRGLVTGEVPANTAARRHFLLVTQGQAIAETDHERAYMKYRRRSAAMHATAADERSDQPAEEVGQRAYPSEKWEQLKDASWPKGYRSVSDL